jgi:ABC-type amino acid transport substrate-binding protein
MTIDRGESPPPAPPSSSPVPNAFRRELFWVGPSLLATVLIASFLLSTLFFAPLSGTNMATILGVPIGMAALIVTILAIRLPGRSSTSVEVLPTRRRRVWIPWTAAVVAPALLITGYLLIPLQPSPSIEPDPAEYLKGTVPIGINGKIPGWSKGEGDSYSGFNIELGWALARKFGFKPRWVPLEASQREQALRDGTVKLIISNYSITGIRQEVVDFAGPYFF